MAHGPDHGAAGEDGGRERHWKPSPVGRVGLFHYMSFRRLPSKEPRSQHLRTSGNLINASCTLCKLKQNMFFMLKKKLEMNGLSFSKGVIE